MSCDSQTAMSFILYISPLVVFLVLFIARDVTSSRNCNHVYYTWTIKQLIKLSVTLDSNQIPHNAGLTLIPYLIYGKTALEEL